MSNCTTSYSLSFFLLSFYIDNSHFLVLYRPKLKFEAFSTTKITVVINRHSRYSTGIVMITRAFNVKSHCTLSMLKSKLIKLIFLKGKR